MTFTRFFGFGLILSVLAAAAKILFLNYFNSDLQVVVYGFWVFMILLTVALVRRLDVINYLEVTLIGIIWFLTMLLFDAMITSQSLGFRVFTTLNIWVGNLLVLLSIILFHKKRHVKIRHEHAVHKKRH